MASLLSFSALVEAMSRAIASAQDQVEKHHISNLLDYFDDRQRPRSLSFLMPSRRADARPGSEDFYSVPLLSLVSVNVLKIKDVRIKFSVDMGEVTEQPSEPAAAASKDPSGPAASDAEQARLKQPMKVLNVSTATGRGGGRFQVTLRVEGSEPSEGAARLLDYLAQMQGIVPEIEEGNSDSAP